MSIMQRLYGSEINAPVYSLWTWMGCQTASAAKNTPSPRLRDSRLQPAIDEVVASIVGRRAFVGGPGTGRPRVEDCADEHRQQQRTHTNKQREHRSSPVQPKRTDGGRWRGGRPKRTEALHTTHRGDAASGAREILPDGGKYSGWWSRWCRHKRAPPIATIAGRAGALNRIGACDRATPARPGCSSVGGARNVLMLLAVGLTIWLYIGVLTAQLFGAFVSGSRRDRDEDD
jgi:hypothetical protein